MLIHQARPEATLARLIQTPPSGPFEAWTFDDRAARQSAEAALANTGIQARIRSAYKPLLCFFREEARPGFDRAQITLPAHSAAAPGRFLLETYPLTALLPGVALSFCDAPAQPDGDPGALSYEVALHYPEGTETHRVRAPNRLHVDAVGTPQLSPTGWLITPTHSARLATEYETLFEQAIAAVAAQDWGPDTPYFQELNIAITLPAQDEPLGYGAEALSLSEALHEDLYFSLLELLQHRAGLELGDRRLQPGQIVPEIRTGPTPALRLETRPLNRQERAAPTVALETAPFPPSVAQIRAELAAIGGTPFEARSYAGRIVAARHHPGQGAAVMISAGQHANETSPIPGALRAAHRLARAGAHFTIAPLENPDGYALHGRLCADNPNHMHHGARYTALGDDLEYRQPPGPPYEQDIRAQALARSGAQLHINLHGYPAHEWTRPLTGYVPRNFAAWTLPKGFFLMLRHAPGWEQPAQALLEAITADLAQISALCALNARQLALYRTHTGGPGFDCLNGFPCHQSTDPQAKVPLVLISEYPDETIQGAAYVAAHEAQMRTVLAAHAAWQRLAPTAPKA